MTRAEQAALIKKIQEERQRRPVVSAATPAPAPQPSERPSGLVGSEKQVAWGRDIQTRLLATLEADALRHEQAGDIGAVFAQRIREAIPVLLWERRAAKWIEHRNDEAFQLISWASDLKLLGENSLHKLA